MHTSHFPANPLVQRAREACERGEIPVEAYRSYRNQSYSAKQRGIAFEFSIQDWWNWWQVDGRWHHRGIGANKLVMARKGDQGPYSPENVFCCTHSENILMIDRKKQSAKMLKTMARKKLDPNFHHHLAVRGDGHPKSRAVITPMGRFGSIALAGEAYGISRQGAGLRARDQRNGWRYEAA